MAEALAVVKVGNSECGLVKRTPAAISAAMAGAVRLVHHAGAQPVGDEQDDVGVTGLLLSQRRESQEQTSHTQQHFPHQRSNF